MNERDLPRIDGRAVRTFPQRMERRRKKWEPPHPNSSYSISDPGDPDGMIDIIEVNDVRRMEY